MPSKDNPIELSIIIPAFNEEAMLGLTTDTLGPHLDNLVGENAWEFVIVDNGSQDGTFELIDELAKRWNVQKVRLPNPDYGNALHNGLMAARGSYSQIINVDFWDIPYIRWAWVHRKRYHLIIASKLADTGLNKQPKYRRFLSWGLNSILHFYFGFVGTDTHGPKLLSMKEFKPILKKCRMRRGQYDTEFSIRALRSGLRIAEVPVPITEQRPPRNLMLGKICRNLVDIVRLRRAIQSVKPNGSTHYHMWSRDDVMRTNAAVESKKDGGSVQASSELT